ncbi:unnamed protein product [Rotaria sp. Silwood2]|nr:unnamed protein product [Rotaria sp. Silwood2]CAF2698482.1 unnamed protein product [Rotaria sp. Silwood2]CAF4343110.1 unnamed protein product [Rotaria sp. Silwood2]CAF4410060.1 unnamed protein product [Rotaria sp. Silwood2]
MDNNISKNYQNIGDQGNMEIDERNMNINDKNTEQHHKRSRNLTEVDEGVLQSPKNRRTLGDFGTKEQNNRGSFIIRNQNYHHRNVTTETRTSNHYQKQCSIVSNNLNENIDFNRYNINEQSISYAFDMHLPLITMECKPKLKSKDIATKLIMLFFKEIELDFRKQHPNHKKPIGFERWWQDADGVRIFGETKDVDLFIYLCEAKRYPNKIENTYIVPDPPKRLPPQNTVVIKFVRNDIELEEIRNEIKDRYKSTYTVENMLGTLRSNNRHVRVDFSDKKDYDSILNSGVIGVQGQLFDVDEYLPAPKILICTKCNEPGHTKKQCRLSFEKCRRCGENRLDNNDHKLCSIKCQHCGSGEHFSNDHRCPSILDFRRQIVSELRKRPNCLPPQVQLFIPVDCRPIGNSTKILNNASASSTSQKINCLTNNNFTHKSEWPSLPAAANSQQILSMSAIGKQLIAEQTIKSFSNDLNELKQDYLEEQRKIDQRFQEQLKNIQNGWLAIQNQISTQNEMINTTCTLIDDILFDSCIHLTNMMVAIVNELNNKVTTEEEKKRYSSIDEHIKIMSRKILDKKQSYYNYQEQLNTLMSQQRTAAILTMNSIFLTNNVQQ